MIRAAPALCALAVFSSVVTAGCDNESFDGRADAAGTSDGAPADASPPDASPPDSPPDLGLQPCRVPDAAIARLAYSTDGRRLAIGDVTGAVTVLEPGASVVRTIQAASGFAPRIALTEDGGLLAAAARDGQVLLFAVADGKLVRTLTGEGGSNISLKFSDDPAPLLLAAFAPGPTPGDNLKVWRISDGVLVGSLAGSPLATFTYADAAVLLLDEAQASYEVVSFGGRLLRRASFPRPLARTAFAADGAFLGGVVAAGSEDERIAIMSVADDTFVWQSSQANQGTRQLLFLENPSRLVQLAARARIHDHADGRLLLELPALDQAQVATVAPDGAHIAAVIGDGQLVLISTSDGSQRPICP